MACLANDQPCTGDGQCCGGHCDAFNTCACQGSGSYCDATSPCCSTLTCGRANPFDSYDTCLPSCVIQGQAYVQGARNPANPCLYCDVQNSQTDWSYFNNDGNGDYPVCAGSGTTASLCYQGICSADTCQTSGQLPRVPVGASCSGGVGAAGPLCVTGPSTCASGCFIDGQFHYSGDYSPDGCGRCLPATSTTRWDSEPDGELCNGGVCFLGKCAPNGCTINGVHYAPSDVNPADSCGECRPDIDPNHWVPQWGSQGQSCTTNSFSGYCYDTTCFDACHIGGATIAAFHAAGDTGCLGCNPLLSTTALTNLPDGLSCFSPIDSNAFGVCRAGTCYVR